MAQESGSIPKKLTPGNLTGNCRSVIPVRDIIPGWWLWALVTEGNPSWCLRILHLFCKIPFKIWKRVNDSKWSHRNLIKISNIFFSCWKKSNSFLKRLWQVTKHRLLTKIPGSVKGSKAGDAENFRNIGDPKNSKETSKEFEWIWDIWLRFCGKSKRFKAEQQLHCKYAN